VADAAYGLWPLVILNTALFVAFALSFLHPRTKRDWRVMGGYTAFLVVLFTEMYGTLLTVYVLGSWLGTRFPLLRNTHSGGFLLVTIGFLVQWPTIPTVVMFPILVWVYARLARREEREVAARFGAQWDEYAARTPAFIPRQVPGADRVGRDRRDPQPTPRAGNTDLI